MTQGWASYNGEISLLAGSCGDLANGDPRAQAALENVAHQLTRFLNGCAAPDRLFQWESLSAPEEPNEPFSLQWFLAIEHIRHSRSARWIPRLMEFTRHAGETLLGLGSGLGTDWLQYARYGAQVIACSRFAEEVALIRRNFALRGLRGRFLQAEPWAIPLPDASVDVVCLSGVLHEVERPAEVVAELWRLLRPGGKVLAIVPAKYGIDWWLGWLPRRRMRNHTPSSVPLVDGPFNSCPRPNFFSKRRLRKLFDGFEHCRVHKRHLSRREIPFLLRGVPRSWLERLLGRLLILKAFKPVHVSIAASLRQAA